MQRRRQSMIIRTEKAVLLASAWAVAFRKFRPVIFAAILAALATSCMVGPNYKTPKSDVEPAWTPNPAITNRPFSDAEIYWWRNFNDPALDRLVGTACSNNLSLQIAGARILETRARLNQSIGNLFPQQQGISGQVNYSQLNNSLLSQIPGVNPDYVSDQVLFGATWEIDFWGKYRRGIQSDRAGFPRFHCRLRRRDGHAHRRCRQHLCQHPHAGGADSRRGQKCGYAEGKPAHRHRPVQCR